MKFQTITFFLDGSIWDQSLADDASLDSNEIERFAKLVTFDCTFRESNVESPIGPLRFDWIGSDEFGFGGSSWFIEDRLITAGLYLFGSNPSKEIELLNQYIHQWRANEITRQLRPAGDAFTECLNVKERPFMVGLNTGALPPETYASIASYNLYLASLFFSRLQSGR